MPDTRTPNERIALRQYTREDFAEVVRLWQSSGLLPSPSDTFSELERARRRDPDLFLVAARRGKVVGVVLGRFDGRRGWIQHLAVAPAARHRGLGGRLMSEVERRLSEKGCPKVNLHVEPSNDAVCGFYEQLGYDRRNLIFMQKWLRATRMNDQETGRSPSRRHRVRPPARRGR